ncbi:hypothetical protein FA13DRAFT_1741542 [Coprinellus micaceus]|uniref:Secreted protein n=1 Tax=Coprinellus micaceus TaxID=71717 RepID=A0A4Y7SIV6_COPMI|nr:hypothetical protein FA13DRAFT_1741542 [Coprinellus micaceus]
MPMNLLLYFYNTLLCFALALRPLYQCAIPTSITDAIHIYPKFLLREPVALPTRYSVGQ